MISIATPAPRWLLPSAIVLAVFTAAALGWWLGQPKPVQETYASAQRQADGSTVLERRPNAQAKPKQAIPKKTKLERVSQITVQPNAIATPGKPCPPVTIDMSLVREQDGSRRVLASSPDGDIVAGLDIPVETAAPQEKPKRWAAGLSWSPLDNAAGVWIERDVPVFRKTVRVGLDLNQPAQPGAGVDTRLRVGFAF